MTLRRAVATGLSCAGLYAAVLGGAALAQDPTPTGTPESSPTPAVTAISETPTPTATVETATPTATASPDVTASPTDTPTSTSTASPTPFPSPVQTVIAPSPTGTATPQSLGLDLTHPRKPNRSHGNTTSGDGSLTGEDCPAEPARGDRVHAKSEGTVVGEVSISTSASVCGADEPAGPVVTDTPRPEQLPDGTPTPSNPNFSLALPGAAPIGVPNFFIDKFRIPPFLLPIYQAAGIQYGVRWEVLAAINEIETDYGRNLNVSTAGALGWMQFMPSTWKQYGVDANQDKFKDPYNPVDAIFAAARYLRAAGAETDIRRAVFAYNHADWYVDSVLMRARLIGGLPSNFVGSLTGLTEGRFPVHAKATYAGQVTQRESRRKVRHGNAAYVVESNKHRHGIKIFARRGAPVVSVNDGRIVRVGETKRLGRYVQLQDVYGNTYTYARLAKVAKTYPAPKLRKTSRAAIARELKLPRPDA
ncbi:MAG: lytic murein transglycosylase, partial [Actinomycetota bacterium]|nr:lytic murein transglycosylase [Actinomycetota bacterium]